MRQYVINELRRDDVEKIGGYLAEHAEAGAIDGLFFLPLPAELLAEAQEGHADCGPFVLPVELGDDFVSFELLVRSRDNLHCSCNSFATRAQRDFVMDFAEEMIRGTGL